MYCKNSLNGKIQKRKPLIVWGARQTGKTTLIRDLFAKNYYEKSYIYIDFKLEENICDFCLKTADPSKIMEYISLNKQMKINENTLLIFDEVQECPNLISALKYFCQDHREIPVIATGSMVRTKIIRETNKRGRSENGKFLFPIGKIDQMTLYPLTFEEYLFNSSEPPQPSFTTLNKSVSLHYGCGFTHSSRRRL